MTEAELINKCKNNDKRAQKYLYDLYARKMMGVCIRYASDVEIAKDFLQEGFLKVFNSLESYNFNGSFEGWIRRIMVNTSLEHIRKNDILKETEDISLLSEYFITNSYILESLSAQELISYIDKLPAGYKLVFNLYAIEGYSYSEISEILNIEESTCRSQYMRARKHLQKVLLNLKKEEEKYIENRYELQSSFS